MGSKITADKSANYSKAIIMEKILIIGFGNMGQAIGRALIGGGFDVWASDRDAKKIKSVAKVKAWNRLDNLQKFDAVIVAVKPQDVLNLAGQVAVPPDTILVSIAAGLKLAKLSRLFNTPKIIRMMPNLGLSVGQGIAAWKASGLSLADKRQAKRLLDATGENFEIKDEKMIDAVTAISGSGPAYFFEFAKFLAASAKNLGLTSEQARLLVRKTFSASAALSENGNYQELIDRVASKKGTTEAALKVFDKYHLNKIVSNAVQAAYKRAGELSK